MDRSNGLGPDEYRELRDIQFDLEQAYWNALTQEERDRETKRINNAYKTYHTPGHRAAAERRMWDKIEAALKAKGIEI